MFNRVKKFFRKLFRKRTSCYEVKRELCLVIRQLLRALEDGRVTKEEIVHLRRLSYDVLLKYDLDKPLKK